jgi:Flp pilus assembly pilin Flp
MEIITRLYLRLREAASGAYRGQTYSEYALIFVCIVVALVGGYQLIGNNLSNEMNGLANQVGNS